MSSVQDVAKRTAEKRAIVENIVFIVLLFLMSLDTR